MMYAMMLRDFDDLEKGKYYPIVDTLIDDGSAVIDKNKGRIREELSLIPSEYYVRMTEKQVAEQIKKQVLGGKK